MRSVLTAAILLVLKHSSGFGQIVDQVVNDKLPFEVASVKPLNRAGPEKMSGGPGTTDPERITYAVKLRHLLSSIYRVPDDQISGLDPMESAPQYEILAKIPRGTTPEQFDLMLRNLLAERFHLSLHHETRDFTIYELVVAKNGSKLQESVVDPNAPPQPRFPPKGNLKYDKDGFLDLPPGYEHVNAIANGRQLVTAKHMAISDLIDVFTFPLGSHVVDKTGLTGKYGIRLQFAGSAVPGSVLSPGVGEEGSAPTIFDAVEKQLGLKLVKTKAPLDTLVIDHVDKIPTGN
jgi:uncharacterized protein (TIGR03435 family)